MARHTSTQDILAAARQRNEDRLAAVERLVGERGTRAGIAAAEAEMAEVIAAAQVKVDRAKAADAAAYAAALKVWSVAELRGVGIRPLDGKQPRPVLAQAATRSRRRKAEPAEGATEEEQRAADELTAMAQEMGTYDQPSPALVG